MRTRPGKVNGKRVFCSFASQFWMDQDSFVHIHTLRLWDGSDARLHHWSDHTAPWCFWKSAMSPPPPLFTGV